MLERGRPLKPARFDVLMRERPRRVDTCYYYWKFHLYAISRLSQNNLLYRSSFYWNRDDGNNNSLYDSREAIIVVRKVLFNELYTAQSIILRYNEILWPVLSCIEWCYRYLMVLVSPAPVLNTERFNALYRPLPGYLHRLNQSLTDIDNQIGPSLYIRATYGLCNRHGYRF